MNLRINAESIALYDSSEMELASINGTFKNLLGKPIYEHNLIDFLGQYLVY
jgi:hypothetical protein